MHLLASVLLAVTPVDIASPGRLTPLVSPPGSGWPAGDKGTFAAWLEAANRSTLERVPR
jgi:hypothetical protein